MSEHDLKDGRKSNSRSAPTSPHREIIWLNQRNGYGHSNKVAVSWKEIHEIWRPLEIHHFLIEKWCLKLWSSKICAEIRQLSTSTVGEESLWSHKCNFVSSKIIINYEAPCCVILGHATHRRHWGVYDNTLICNKIKCLLSNHISLVSNSKYGQTYPLQLIN